MNNIIEEISQKCCSYCEMECDGCWLEELITDRLTEERKKVCEQIYQLFTNGRMWSTMKDWWLNNGTCIELKQVLDAVENGMENQEIIKKFSKDRSYYALLDNLREQHFLVLNKNELDQIERGE